jgi:glutathione synthase/RimK-type ligase-like ATP-grasp enzyme
MQVVFATCEQQPLMTADDQVLEKALRQRGVEVSAIPWTEIDPFSVVDAPPVLLRSTWDYHRKPTLFRSWLDAFAGSGRAMWNPPAVARANVDKIYLKTLEDAGIAIPKTRWIDRADSALIASVMREERWDRAVLKPRIAATAYGTFLIDEDTQLDEDSFAPARSSGALLQEVIPEVKERGEISIVYVAGEFSHAVIKRAKDGEFRVQKDFGGRVEVLTPSPAVGAFADRVRATVPHECLYARIDVVDTRRGPLLMELELIEPELYFAYVPDAAERLAQVIVPQLMTA